MESRIKEKEGNSGQTKGHLRTLLNARRSLHKIISEDEFIEPLQEHVKDFFLLATTIRKGTGVFDTGFYFNLMNESEKLETFLDDYGARDNMTWNYFSELIASIRNFAIAAFHLTHVMSRYLTFDSDESEAAVEEFLTHGEEALRFINSIESDLIAAAIAELKERNCTLDLEDAPAPDIKTIKEDVKLPRNLDTDMYSTSEHRILQIVESYRKVALKIHRDRYGKQFEPEELAKMVPSRVNETRVKILENALHNIQSEYDTHIKKTQLEQSNPDLKRLRAFISIPMHMLEMARWIIHFYERHENEIHSDESRNRISNIVDKNLALSLVSKFSFYYAHKYSQAGKKIAEKIMSDLIQKERITVPIPKPSGFHARPAFYVTLVVEEHGTDVFMYVGDRKYDARSVLDLLEAGGHVADMNIDEVVFEGDARTLRDLAILAESNYCEDEMVPKELNYIRVARNLMT